MDGKRIGGVCAPYMHDGEIRVVGDTTVEQHHGVLFDRDKDGDVVGILGFVDSDGNYVWFDWDD
jgi:hypothetical protein